MVSFPNEKETTVTVVYPHHTMDRHASEWWPDKARNGGPTSFGMLDRHGPEPVADMARNTHLLRCGYPIEARLSFHQFIILPKLYRQEEYAYQYA